MHPSSPTEYAIARVLPRPMGPHPGRFPSSGHRLHPVRARHGALRPPEPPQLQRYSAEIRACDRSAPVVADTDHVQLLMNGISIVRQSWTRIHTHNPSNHHLLGLDLSRGSPMFDIPGGEAGCSCHTCHIPKSWTSAERSRDVLTTIGALWPVSNELSCARLVIPAPWFPTEIAPGHCHTVKGKQKNVYGLVLTCL